MIKEFLKKHQHEPIDFGSIELLFHSLYCPEMKPYGIQNVWGLRWLVRLMISVFHTSPLIKKPFILVGPGGIGKTEFFRRLLPDELKDFYGEAHDKNKLITCIDHDVNFKRNIPVIDMLKQYKYYKGVLCATSNNLEIFKSIPFQVSTNIVLVESIDWKIYNSIDKTALLMELFYLYKKTMKDAAVN